MGGADTDGRGPGPMIGEETLKRFDAGVCMDVYQELGAHPMTVDGVEGTRFAVWAPSAGGVSVVGDFNGWDAGRHPMERLGDHGVFACFIPGVGRGDLYKYGVLTSEGDTVLKADPYGMYAELRPGSASVVWGTGRFEWTDGEWMRRRASWGKQFLSEPFSVYEVHLGSWKRGPAGTDGQAAFLNYRELAVEIAEYVQEMGYTHIELMPVMEHLLDRSWGYQTIGYYAPTSRYGDPDDFRYFMNYMHGKGIGVILDWTPAHFPRDQVGLARFDGTCLYGHRDPRRGTHPQWGTLAYNYKRPQVSNFLMANALYWVKEFHADGIRVNAADAMLRLDYGREAGQWIPNLYGGNEDLDAVDFLKRLSAVLRQQGDGAVLIAEDSTAWPKVTADTGDGGLGFDLKWNNGWTAEFLSYMNADFCRRSGRYGGLTFPMLYAYSENFMLALGHDEFSRGKYSMVSKMPGETLEIRLSALRAAYGFWMTQPGKKLLFMGQDIAMISDWDEETAVPWQLLEFENHRRMRDYVRDLHTLYRGHPALYRMDHHPDGFEWVDCLSGDSNILIYLRRSRTPEETLLVICNFSREAYEGRRVGVPCAGDYREIFCSDLEEYGGSGVTNPDPLPGEAQECDGRPWSAAVRVAPLGIHVFACPPGDQ